MHNQKKDHNNTNGNGSRKSNRSPPYALFNLVVILVAIAYGIYYQLYLKDTEVSARVDKKPLELVIDWTLTNP